MDLGRLYEYADCTQIVKMVDSDGLKVIQNYLSRAIELESQGKEFDYNSEIGDMPCNVLSEYRDCLYIPVFDIETPIK